MPDATPPSQTLRTHLRAATAQAHGRLDRLMANGLRNGGDYRAYLQGMHAFVASLVPGLAEQAHTWRWPLPVWQHQLEDDLDVLQTARLVPEPVTRRTNDAALGALYVMEGASLGARMLCRGAAALGFQPERGARFLHAHADGEGGRRWPRFVEFLGAHGRHANHAVAAAAADDTFALAERCFRRALGAPA